jgi:hypothetical protein
MINNLQTNLQKLYKADFSHLSETVLRNLEATEEIQLLRQTIKANIPGSNWSLLRTEILAETQQLLEIDLYPILIASWKTHQDVIREINAQKYLLKSSSDSKNDIAADLANKVAIVNLDEHEVKSTHSPCLSINIGDKTHLLRSFIGVTLYLQNVALKIQRGEITEILSGDLSGKGFMQYQNATLIEKDFLEFSISGLTKSTPDSATSLEKKPPVVNLTNNNPLNQQRSIDQPASMQASQDPSLNSSHINVSPQKKASTSTNMLQFLIGISLALLAVFLFWQLK